MPRTADRASPHPLKAGLIAALLTTGGGTPLARGVRRRDLAAACEPPAAPFFDALPQVEFGLEVEANGLDPWQTAALVQPLVGRVQVEPRTPWAWLGYADVPRKGRNVGAYRAVCDESLAGARSVELVTPPLSYRQTAPLKESLAAMRAAGATVDSLAALHVHVNHTSLPARAVVTLIRVFTRHEALIFRLSGTSPRQLQHWCKALPPEFLRRLRDNPGLAKVAIVGHLSATAARPLFTAPADALRYHALGLAYLEAGETLEYRQLGPTLLPEVLQARLDLVLALTLRARDEQLGCLMRASLSADRPEDVARFLDLIGIRGPELTRSRQILLHDAAHPVAFELADGEGQRLARSVVGAALGLWLASLWQASPRRELRFASRMAWCMGQSSALYAVSLLAEASGLGTYAWTHAARQLSGWRLLCVGEPLRMAAALALRAGTACLAGIVAGVSGRMRAGPPP